METSIFHFWEQKIKEINARIENISLAVKAELDAEARESLRRYETQLYEQVELFKDRRKEEIAKFRDWQGVFADG